MMMMMMTTATMMMMITIVIIVIIIIIPELYCFAHASYSCRLMLRHASNVLRTEEGTQQGDPLGSLAFCITLQSILLNLKSELRVSFLETEMQGECGGPRCTV